MKGIWIARFLNLKRKPLEFLITTGMMIVFALILSSSSESNPTIYAVTDGSSNSKEIVRQLKELDGMDVEEILEKEAELQREDDELVSIKLNEESFSILTGSNTPLAVEATFLIRHLYNELLFQHQITEMVGQEKWREIEFEIQETKAFNLEMSSMNDKQVFRYDGSLSVLFGYMLFFVYYTISTNVQFILEDKLSGIWNRMRLTSLSRIKLYLGHLSFSFLIGFCQLILVALLFHFVIGTNMYGGLGKVIIILAFYVLFVISISLLIIALVKNISQAGIATSLLAVAFAMLGGAFWPLEIVESSIVLSLKWISPVYYGMEALKRVTIYGETIYAVSTYLLVMILLSAAFFAISIYLLERRSNRGHTSE